MKIRSVLAYMAPVYTSMLTTQNISDIERIQKIVFKILLNDNYLSYIHACNKFNTPTLEKRRENLSSKFALSCLENPQHKHLFVQKTSPIYKLRNIKSFETPHCNSTRYFNSPIPYLTRLLNQYFKTTQHKLKIP